jgi:hypothetical protein
VQHGNLQVCGAMYPYETARSEVSGDRQVSGGSPAAQDRIISVSRHNGDTGAAATTSE